jgi:hypothetical protein
VSLGHDENGRKDDVVPSMTPFATLTGTILIAPRPLRLVAGHLLVVADGLVAGALVAGGLVSSSLE